MLHQLKIWVTSFSCGRWDPSGRGRFSHFFRTRVCSAGFHPLFCLLVSELFFCTDRLHLAACRSRPALLLFCWAGSLQGSLHLLLLLLASSKPPTFIRWDYSPLCCLVPPDSHLLPFCSLSGLQKSTYCLP